MAKQKPAGFEVGNGSPPHKKEGGGLRNLFNKLAAPAAGLWAGTKWTLGKVRDTIGWGWDNKAQAAGILLIGFPAAGGLFNAVNPDVNPEFGFNQTTGTAMWDGAAKVYEFEGAVAMGAVRFVSNAYNTAANGVNVAPGVDLPTFDQDKTQGDIQYVLTCNPYHRGTLHPLSETSGNERKNTIESNAHYRFFDEQIQAAMMDGNHQMHDKMADGYHPVILVPPAYSKSNKTLTYQYKHTADEQVCPVTHPNPVRTPVNIPSS